MGARRQGQGAPPPLENVKRLVSLRLQHFTTPDFSASSDHGAPDSLAIDIILHYIYTLHIGFAQKKLKSLPVDTFRKLKIYLNAFEAGSYSAPPGSLAGFRRGGESTGPHVCV